ncbi:hypothetical protein PHYPSEUDO_009394 [Phytophthora pseudosyringae]|uniref:Cyclic nucleotide-binding domain-containing protein n=1 Tax=Phytophthora pseudosyringae TaxID=221518 RepID=A0A8T1WCF6_9STRA|nr:hypothetical protein PHYPSEUDO_009394 [Phytophthora pseudosyringae]
MTSRPVTTPVPTRGSAGVPGLNVRPASSSHSSGRPYSASNLPTSIANARFKNFQVQHDILCRNPILAAIAQEIPWKNLFDLFLLKFYAVGDKLWAQGEQPHELAFVLCGGFLARNMEDEVQAVTTTDIFETEKPKARVLAERMIKPGGSLAALSVLKGTPLPYAIVTARFKSILLSLSSQRLKSVMRQLKPVTQEAVEQLVHENEQKLMESLSLPFRVRRDPRVSTTPASKKLRAGTTPQFTGRPNKRIPSSLVDRILGSSEKHESAAMKRSASASAVADGAPSWASLQVAKPMEYEVNSSLLILHQSSSTGKLRLPSSTTSKSALLRSSNLSAVASQIAKKHTQRRLDSIKLPTQTEAFPPRHLTNQRQLLEKDGGGHCMEMVEQLLERQLTKRVAADVVPKDRVGRLLKPLKKPATIPYTSTNNDGIGESMGPRRGRRVLVANRCEHFRDAHDISD